MANVLQISKKKLIRSEQSSWSDDYYYEIPFTCNPDLTDANLFARLEVAVSKKFPVRTGGGLNSHTFTKKFDRLSPTTGTLTIMHWCGIGS